MPSFLIDLMTHLSQWMRPWLDDISTALVASVLVIYGNQINRWVRNRMRGAHFILRTAAFVLLCAFGYGLATVTLSPLLFRLLLNMGVQWYGTVVIALFLIVGLIAQHRNYQ